MSTKLKTKLQKHLSSLEKITDLLPIEDKMVYGNWLAQTHYFVCHSTRLLALASSKFSLTQNKLHYRFSDHIKEEKGHEKMPIHDLKAIGLSLSLFPELQQTKAFYQTQYYWVDHVHPISLYGYILCLEAFAIGGAVRIYDKVLKTYGDQAGVFLKVHTHEDVEHLNEALKQVSELGENEIKLIEENMDLSFHLYSAIYTGILEHTKNNILKRNNELPIVHGEI